LIFDAFLFRLDFSPELNQLDQGKKIKPKEKGGFPAVYSRASSILLLDTVHQVDSLLYAALL